LIRCTRGIGFIQTLVLCAVSVGVIAVAISLRDAIGKKACAQTSAIGAIGGAGGDGGCGDTGEGATVAALMTPAAETSFVAPDPSGDPVIGLGMPAEDPLDAVQRHELAEEIVKNGGGGAGCDDAGLADRLAGEFSYAELLNLHSNGVGMSSCGGGVQVSYVAPPPDPIKCAVDGAVYGDMIDQPSTCNVVGQVIAGFTPPGVAGDVRDVFANLGKIWNGEEGGWSGLGLAAVGIVPAAGDVLKGVGKGSKVVRGAEVLGAIGPGAPAAREAGEEALSRLIPVHSPETGDVVGHLPADTMVFRVAPPAELSKNGDPFALRTFSRYPGWEVTHVSRNEDFLRSLRSEQGYFQSGDIMHSRTLGDLMVPGNKLYRDNVFDYGFGFDDITALVVRGPNTRWVDD
jgi:hypothetical protein